MARAEVEALTRAPAVPLGRGLIGTPFQDAAALERLGYARAIMRCLGHSDVPTAPFDPRTVVKGSFAVRAHLVDAAPGQGAVRSVSLSAEIGESIGRQVLDAPIDLVHPDTDIQVFATPDGFWWGQVLFEIDGAPFAARYPTRRPFWRSTAMPPRKARCLVNLAAAPPGGLLLDPFCGTASVPIEAALLGLRVYASDVDYPLVAGAARNLAALDLQHRVDLRLMDARAWADSPLRFDAIVSDLPYGRTASVKGVDRELLYRDFLDTAARILNTGARAVLMVPQGTLPAPSPSLTPRAHFFEVVNSSLTREVIVLEQTASALP
jgi:tRNA (guanine10-N2)-dimethyltransferase